MDIVAAIGTKESTASGLCVIGRWLSTIPEDTPGKDQLVQMLSTPTKGQPGWRRLEEIGAILRRLEFDTSTGTIGAHRLGQCRCHQ